MYGSNYGYGHFMSGFGGFWMIVFWIVIVVGAVVLIKILFDRSGDKGSQRDPIRGDSPMDILKRRYAAGDIDHEEFERRKHDIMST